MGGPKAALIPTLSCHSLVYSDTIRLADGLWWFLGRHLGCVLIPGFPEAESRKPDQGQRQKPKKPQKPLRPNLRKSLGSLAISGLRVGICGVPSRVAAITNLGAAHSSCCWGSACATTLSVPLVRAKFLMLAQKYRKWLCFAFFPRSLLNVSAHETSPLQVQDCPPWLTALSRKYLPARRPGLRTWLWPLATPFLPLIPKQRCAPAFTIWFSYFSSVLLLDSKSDGFPRFI